MEEPGRKKYEDVPEDLIASGETDDDQIVNLTLRPRKLDEFTGQSNLRESLDIALRAALKRKEPLEHILFSGPPGLGKTSLAHIVANELNTKIVSTSGPAIERAGDLIGILTNLGHGDVLFIDEIHRLSKVVEEFIYPAMENFQIDFLVDKGPYAKTIKFNLKPFTVIGATTRAGLLSSPLRDRFGMHLHLEFYSEEELTKIIKRSSGLLEIVIEDAAAIEIARRSRGTPRVANRLLRRVRDWVEVKADGKITLEAAKKALEKQGIDHIGLTRIDRRFIEIILKSYNGGPVGLNAVASSLNEEVDTIEDVIEPYLLLAGLLRRTSRGRELTDKAFEYMGHTRRLI
ncbi:MAG: Holliday junction branch migration DNA helicase RuvB [Candidatus Omnitrophica bacterium]|nr:Holliday junction branch migration DNA helicase RuvB [Candidatus Omnitrophota bacterium]